MIEKLHYFYITHPGKRTETNEDNFICLGRIGDRKAEGAESVEVPAAVSGSVSVEHPLVFGVFDGLGGEQCGEVASLIAAAEAKKLSDDADTEKLSDSRNPENLMLDYLNQANEKIVKYAEENSITSMGTTAALLVFGPDELLISNIGDSKIYVYSNQSLKQLSMDHIAPAPFGKKPPLYQYLGMPLSETIIDPFISKKSYEKDEIYLICSDGLTDMVPEEELNALFQSTPFNDLGSKLLEAALENGGKDNITIILCKAELNSEETSENTSEKASGKESGNNAGITSDKHLETKPLRQADNQSERKSGNTNRDPRGDRSVDKDEVRLRRKRKNKADIKTENKAETKADNKAENRAENRAENKAAKKASQKSEKDAGNKSEKISFWRRWINKILHRN